MTDPVRTWEGEAVPAPGPWDIRRQSSTVRLIVPYLRVARLRIAFHRFSGSIRVAEHPEDTALEAAIEAASIDTGIRALDRILRSRRILDVRRFPRISFRSTAVEVIGSNRLRVTGDLTVREVTRPTALDVEYGGVDAAGGRARARFAARTRVDREEFLTWKELLGIRSWLIGRWVEIDLRVEAVPSAAAASDGR